MENNTCNHKYQVITCKYLPDKVKEITSWCSTCGTVKQEYTENKVLNESKTKLHKPMLIRLTE